jgi:hypothetical protein
MAANPPTLPAHPVCPSIHPFIHQYPTNSGVIIINQPRFVTLTEKATTCLSQVWLRLLRVSEMPQLNTYIPLLRTSPL